MTYVHKMLYLGNNDSDVHFLCDSIFEMSQLNGTTCFTANIKISDHIPAHINKRTFHGLL